MIKEIKYKRQIKVVNDILDNGYLSKQGENWEYFFYKFGNVNYCLFYFCGNEIVIKHHYFVECGMDESISEKELEELIKERFIDTNKTIENTDGTDRVFKFPVVCKVIIK